MQPGLTFIRYCEWLDRVWTFQEIFLARNAIVRVGNEQIDWKVLNRGWDFLLNARFDDHKHTREKFQFIETTRSGTDNLLYLLRTVWNRMGNR